MPKCYRPDEGGCADKAQAFARLCAGRALILLAIISSFSPAYSQDAQTSVRLDGRVLFRVSATVSTPSEERAARVEQRLQTLLLNLEGAAEPRVVSSAEGRLITVAGTTVVTVTQEDAEDSVTSLDRLAGEWSAVIARELERARQQRLGWGGRFLAETRGAVEAAFSIMAESAGAVIPRAIAALLILGIFALLAKGLAWGLRELLRRSRADKTLENLVRQLTYYSVVLIGAFVAAGALGFSPEAVVTGLGLTGLVLGFALKDVLSNFVSGVMILVLRPFEIGDQIAVGETEGAVERIELRATQIRTYDGRVALVPNAEVFTSRIVNNTADPVRRGNVLVKVALGTELAELSGLLQERARQADGVLPERDVGVRVDDVGAEQVVLNISFWTDSRRSDFKDTTSAVRRSAAELLIEMGHRPPDPALRRIAPADGQQWRDLLSAGPIEPQKTTK